jgi:hypothetical protein
MKDFVFIIEKGRFVLIGKGYGIIDSDPIRFLRNLREEANIHTELQGLVKKLGGQNVFGKTCKSR